MIARTCMFLVLLCVNAISAFTTKQIKDRFNYIEDRLNAESNFRREVFQDLDDIKSMLQQTLDDKREGKDTVSYQVPDKTYSEFVHKISVLVKAFRDEKNIDNRFRREIPNIQRQIQDLRTKTEQISETLEDIVDNLESVILKHTEKTLRETAKHFDQLQKQIPMIQDNIRNLEQKTTTTIETLASMSNDMKVLQENQETCLDNVNNYNNLTTRLADKLSNGELYCTVKGNIKPTEDLVNENKCFTTASASGSTTSPTTVTEYKSCKDLFDNGHQISGVNKISVEPGRTISVYCDMTTDGGGWTVFQRRQDESLDFFRSWDDYKTGFGDLNGEFWLGNEYLNLFTDTVKTHELRVDLEDHEGNRAFAKYNRFKVGSESENFKLEVTGYTGDAGDSLENPTSSTRHKYNGMEFSTKDRDNDESRVNCADYFKGGW